MRRAAPLLLAFAAGCMSHVGVVQPTSAESVKVGPSSFLVYYAREDTDSARAVISALRKVAPQTERWGGLPATVTVTVHPTHDALEQAIHRIGYAWLRAWARYDTIDLQSPRTWTLMGASEAQVTSLVAHELTHCAMYQSSGSASNWAEKGIPLWFREGMASVSAGQGERRARRDSLWRYYMRSDAGSGGGDDGGGGSAAAALRSERVGGDPVSDPEPLYQSDADVVYSAAHWAFQFLLERYGEATVRDVLAGMRAGQPFATAFSNVVGISQEEFEADFKRYIVWHGWR